MAPGSFVWTDQETELLLNVTLDYKAAKLQENVDWESCQSKYVDILALFLEHYPSASADFPHQKEDITRGILTTKLKAVRGKYRAAVDTGRRSGHGRVVLLYFEKCEQVWGGSPATATLSAGVETHDLDPTPVSTPSTSEDSFGGEIDIEGDPDNIEAPTVNERRDLLNAQLRGHRHQRLKKRLSAEAQLQNAVEEDQRIKKQLISVIEASEKRATDNFSKVSNTLDRLTSTIVDGFSLLRETIGLLTPQPAQAPLPQYPTTLSQQGHMPPQHSYLPNQMHQVYSQNTSGSTHTHNVMPLSTINTAELSFRPMEGTGQFSYTQALFNKD